MSGDNQGNVTGNPIQDFLASHQQNVGGDHNIPIMNIGGNVTLNTSAGEKMKRRTEKKLPCVVRDYKQFLSETENTTLRTKLDQLQVGSNKFFLQRKLRKEASTSITTSEVPGVSKSQENIQPSLTISEFLQIISKSKTSLVSGPSGSGKSTLAANITVDWAESEDDGTYDLILCLSSLNTTKSLTLHKLVWGEFAGRIGKDSMEIFEELMARKGKILVIIDGLGNKD